MSKSTRVAIGFAAAAVILLTLSIGLKLMNRPSDQAQIQKALQDSLQASREGKPGGVLALLSDQLKVNNQLPPEYSQISQFVRESRPDITVDRTQALVTGDEARIVSPVEVKLDLVGQTMQQHLDNVTLVFRKEPAREFLFVPTTAWRLAEVRLPENGLVNTP
jgi:hypothetical protein